MAANDLNSILAQAEKLSAEDRAKFKALLSKMEEEQAAKAKEENAAALKDFIAKRKMTAEEAIEILKGPAVAIFKWEGNTFFAGTKGKAPAWTKTLKEKLGEAEAIKFALNDDGKAWVKKLYNPSK